MPDQRDAFVIKMNKIIEPLERVRTQDKKIIPIPEEGLPLSIYEGRSTYYLIMKPGSLSLPGLKGLLPKSDAQNTNLATARKTRSPTLPGKIRQSHQLLPITSLNPSELSHSCHLDLSEKTLIEGQFHDGATSKVTSWASSLLSLSYDQCQDQPFPSGTHGFLYAHQVAPDLCAEVRFRITPSNDPATFPQGKDLLLPEGLPWKLHIGHLMRPDKSALRNLLLTDGFLSDSALKVWSTIFPRGIRKTVVGPVDEEFLFDFTTCKKSVWVVQDNHVLHLKLSPFRHQVISGADLLDMRPYTGMRFFPSISSLVLSLL